MITVTRKFHFCYGHHLPEYMGACSRSHGHNSEVEVEVGARCPGDGELYPTMICDFRRLKEAVTPLLDRLDHQYLNTADSSPFRDDEGDPPTAEAIAAWLAIQINEQLPINIYVCRVRVSETPDCWAEWRTE